MWLMYLIVRNFGWAVVLFTLLVKAASFPLSLKQQKNMSISQLFTPRVQEIQKKYRGNQAKIQEEMQKLQKEGYNPMGGCGPMILMMIILFGVIDVVYKPMTHMERFDRDVIAHVQELAKQVEYANIIISNEEDYAVFLDYAGISAPRTAPDSKVSNDQREKIGVYVMNNLASVMNEAGLSDPARNALRGVDTRYRGLQRELQAVQQYKLSPDAFFPLDSAVRAKLDSLQSNMIFLGIDLGEIPQFTTFNRLWAIAMACFFFSVIQMMIQQYIQKRTMAGMNNPAMNSGGMKMMLIMGPMFSLFIVFAVPAGAGLYWTVSYLFTIAQSIIIFKVWPPERMRAEAADKLKAKVGNIAATAKIVDVDDDGNQTVKEEKLSEMSKREQDDYFKKKLEAARRADLEKYGETPDIDLSQYNKPIPEPQPPEDDNENNSEGDK
jgi:YidC/Oxa1 family membrane protein insertase